MFTSLRKALVTTVAMLALVAAPAVVPGTVSAQDDIGNSLKCGSNFDTQGTDCSETDVTAGTERINTIIKDVVNIFSAIVGIVSVIMIIWGGFKYITSGGDSGNVTAAKNTIIYAIIGLIVVALAQFIVQFVLGKVTGP